MEVLDTFNFYVSSIQNENIKIFCPWDTFDNEGIRILAKKIRQEKLLQHIKILKYDKSSCVKMFF